MKVATMVGTRPLSTHPRTRMRLLTHGTGELDRHIRLWFR